MPYFAAIPGNSDDARTVRTRAALAAALIALMQGKGFNEITVGSICKRAKVGRSTFYAHFQDKDELFIRHTAVFGRELGSQLTWDDTHECYRFPASRLFEHVRHMKPMLDSLSQARKTEFVMKVWQNNIAEVFEQRVLAARARAAQKSVIPAVILARQLAGTLMTLLMWWLDHHYPVSEHEMDIQFHRLVARLS